MSLTEEEFEARRAKRLEEHAKAKAEQLSEDLEALDALEAEHGVDRVRRFPLNRFVPGLPTFAVVRVPKPVEHKRFIDQVNAAKGDTAKIISASDSFAAVALVYPDKEQREKLKEEFPQIFSEIAEVAGELCRAKANAEGKG